MNDSITICFESIKDKGLILEFCEQNGFKIDDITSTIKELEEQIEEMQLEISRLEDEIEDLEAV